MLRTGIPAQWVQKQLDDLCVATPPTKRDLSENFVTTHRTTCARVGVKLAPETDKEKAFSSSLQYCNLVLEHRLREGEGHPPHAIRHDGSQVSD